MAKILSIMLAVWAFVSTLTRCAGDVDFVLERAQNPSGGIGILLNWIVAPPAWAPLLAMFLGGVLLWWDLSRRGILGPISAEAISPSHDAGATARPALTENTWLPVLDLFDLAEKEYGWNFKDPSVEILDFIYGLRQAGLHKTIIFWGKKNHGEYESSTRREPIVVINKSHWQSYELDIFKAIHERNNFYVWTLDQSQTGSVASSGFADIQVTRDTAINWLRDVASRYKGHTPRIAARDISMDEAFQILNEAREYPGFEDTFYQDLYDGKISAWGRSIGRDAEDVLPYQKIDREYWLHGRCEWTSAFGGGPERVGIDSGVDFTGVMFNRSQIRQLAARISAV